MLSALVGWTNGECAIKSCIRVIRNRFTPKSLLKRTETGFAVFPWSYAPLPSPFCFLSLCILGTWRSNYIIMTLLFSSSDGFVGTSVQEGKNRRCVYNYDKRLCKSSLFQPGADEGVFAVIVCMCFYVTAIHDISQIHLSSSFALRQAF